jgi:hypothetical protein
MLLKGLSPRLTEDRWVFCVVPRVPAQLNGQALMTFQEPEGLTLIIPKALADSAALEASGIYRQITLEVHSSLEAVGLTAAVSSALAGAGISCNMVAAYYHDHLFVPEADAQRALEVLRGIDR